MKVKLLAISRLLKRMEKAGMTGAIEEVKKAYQFAANAHSGQRRDSGEAFINHPVNVAIIILEMGLDSTSVIAALLHDVVEDTAVGIEEIRTEFGQEIANLVNGLTKLSRISFQTKQEQQVENLRKMFLAMAQDIRVILIKLADRMHNLRTLRHLPVERQKKIARETLEIYSPLSHRLGMYRMKWELEDLAFRFLEPEKYYELVRKVAKKRKEREGYIEEVMRLLDEQLQSLDIRAEIQGRPKHFYSIYQKMIKQRKPFEEIYDLMALRVIVDSVQDCYEVLGVAHTLWKPIPGRFKDYIAMPKSNMYQSLHTTVIGSKGEPVEIQIRTVEMHQIAEYGIAAHWQYKEGDHPADESLLEKIAWLRQLLEWQKESRDVEEYLDNLRVDLFEDEVFVFTPKGDVKSLPAGSTPVDFAYSIHTHIGHNCVGAKVNNRLAPLDYQLKNGDIVQILTTKQGGGPSSDWLQYVVTSKAKNRIRQWLREQRRTEYIQLAKEQLEKEIKKQGLEARSYLKPEKLREVAERLGFSEGEDLLMAVGDGKLSPVMVAGRLIGVPETERQPILPAIKEEKKTRNNGGVKVEGVSNLLVKLSRCCDPVPGDPIIGFITRGKGVSIHRLDCSNLPQEQERLIRVEWDQKEERLYPIAIRIEAADRINLLADIMNVIAEKKFNLNAAKVKTQKGMALIDFILEVGHLDQVRDLERQIQVVEGVQKVFRINKKL